MEYFNTFLKIMAVIAIIVFVALYFVKVGYGVFYNKKWGITIPNRIGWIVMESPVFIVMTYLWINSDRMFCPAGFVIFLFFQLHYLQRSFIFPFLIKGNSRMPVAVILMGALFNVLNALMQGGWIFYVSPEGMYGIGWFAMPQFWIGLVLFLWGMFININSDKYIRGLRKPGDTRHYLPKGGMFNYVTSANYFGELVEWCGFAVMCWSGAGAVFALWTFANLVPRANSIYNSYKKEFATEINNRKLKRIIPFIY